MGSRPVGRGCAGCVPRQEPKRSALWDRKRFKKVTKINAVVLGLTIWMHFQPFEDLKCLIFSEGACPRTSLKPLQCPTLPKMTGLSRFYSRIQCLDSTAVRTRRVSLFEDQLSPANEQKNIFLLNYHNICHKMNKPFNLDLQVNSELQSWRMTQELQNKIT